MAMPEYDKTKSRIAPANGRTWALMLPRARHVTSATTTVAIGTGANRRIFGQANHRSATAEFARGVQMLTMAMATSTATRHTRPCRRAALWMSPSVFQDQPSRAEKPIAEQEGDAGEDREWCQERK